MKKKLHTVYRNSKGKKIPGVTTVLNILSKPALLYWVAKVTKEGLDWQKVRDSGGDIGTLSHYIIECDIKKVKPDTSEYSPADLDKAENCYLSWLEWKDKFGKFKTIASEKQLVSEKYQFGGTLDWVIQKNGDYILIDFKTSKGIFDEMIYQLAAYKQLWDENNPDKKIKNSYILRIGKEDGEFEQKKFCELKKEWEIFFYCLKIYELKKKNFLFEYFLLLK